MAHRTVQRKAGLYVIRVRRRPIFRNMASVAILRRARERTLRMALVALHRYVKACQRKLGLRMIKLRTAPIRGRMALCTILRKSSRLMIRIIGSLEIAKVAPDAGRRRSHKLIVFVACDARHCRMCARKGKAKSVVINLGIQPTGRGVAQLASCREAGRRVWRVRGRLIILQMTPIAGRRRTGKLAVDVARVASNRNVRAIQRKVRKQIVIELSAQPAARVH